MAPRIAIMAQNIITKGNEVTVDRGPNKNAPTKAPVYVYSYLYSNVCICVLKIYMYISMHVNINL
jgi:hypothetical protein